MIHSQDHRSNRSHMLQIFCRAFFNFFSLTSQVLSTVAVENTFVFVRPDLVSDRNLTSDRWVSVHTVTYVCVCEYLCVFLLIYNSEFLELLKRLWGKPSSKVLEVSSYLVLLFYIPLIVTLINRKYTWTILTLLFF